MNKFLLIFVFCFKIFPLFGQEALSSSPKVLGIFDDWAAYESATTEGKTCYIAASPKRSTGKYKARDDVFLIVTHRPFEKSFGVISFIAGYPYKNKNTPTVSVDKNKPFFFITLDNPIDTAWSPNIETDRLLIDQMKKGDLLTVIGTSRRNNESRDTFSLKGFSEAFQEIGKICQVKND